MCLLERAFQATLQSLLVPQNLHNVTDQVMLSDRLPVKTTLIKIGPTFGYTGIGNNVAMKNGRICQTLLDYFHKEMNK